MNLRFLETINKKNFILCNPNSDELMVIQHKDEKLDIWLNDIWELSFTVDNLNINGDNDNFYYPLIIKDRIIKIQNIGEFVITNVQENDNGITQNKKVSCKSLEYNITKKSISYMECKAYKFYDIFPNNISSTFMGIIMSYLPNWTIGHIDTELYNLYRIFDISSDTSIYNLLIENAQAAYECIFQFDRLNKTINAFTKDKIVNETDIFISFDNLIKELAITPLNDGICTALIVNGANDMSINLVNPLGTSTIYNLDNVIDNIDEKTGIRLMTIDTANAWKSWKIQYDNLKISYANNLLSIKNKKSEILNLKAQLSNINAEIKALNTTIASFDTLDEDKTALVNQYNAKIIERNNVEDNINTLNKELMNFEEQLKQTNSTLKFSSFFTPTQLKELDNFITIGNYSDENFAITDSMSDVEIMEMTQELFDKAHRQLNIVSKNRYSFDINMLCPFFVENFLTFKEQLDLGSQITLCDSKENYYYPLLIGISMSFDKLNDIKFTFSESLKNQNEEFNLSQLLGKTANVATNIALNNLKYIDYVNSGDKIVLKKMREDALNTDKQEIINGEKRTIIFDDSGLLCRTEDVNDNSGYSQYQSRLTEKGLFFTSDYWKHVGSAYGWITLPNGSKTFAINTDVLWGDIVITQNLQIHNDNNSFVVDENGATLTNATLSLVGNNGLNKMYFDPIFGFKIQKKVDSKWIDNFSLDASTGDIIISNYSTTEQMNSAITISANKIQSQITDTNGNIATLTQTVNGLSSTISSQGGNISTLHQTASSLQSQIAATNGNVSTVTQTANNLSVAINNTKVTIDGVNGVTIRNGGFRIKNSYDNDVFSVDTSGNMTLAGNLYNTASNKTVRLYNGKLEIGSGNSAGGNSSWMQNITGTIYGAYYRLHPLPSEESIVIEGSKSVYIRSNWYSSIGYGLGSSGHVFNGNVTLNNNIIAFGKTFTKVKQGTSLTSSDYIMVAN